MDIKAIIKVILYPVILLFTTVTKLIWKDYPDDNPVEEVIEFVIEKETGHKVDLTPESPEENNGN
jgi:hypothetical protein